jgi:hypothetical protein
MRVRALMWIFLSPVFPKELRATWRTISRFLLLLVNSRANYSLFWISVLKARISGEEMCR